MRRCGGAAEDGLRARIRRLSIGVKGAKAAELPEMLSRSLFLAFSRFSPNFGLLALFFWPLSRDTKWGQAGDRLPLTRGFVLGTISQPLVCSRDRERSNGLVIPTVRLFLLVGRAPTNPSRRSRRGVAARRLPSENGARKKSHSQHFS